MSAGAFMRTVEEAFLDFLMLILLGAATALIVGYIHVCGLLTEPVDQSTDKNS
jgi:hypothetical protein